MEQIEGAPWVRHVDGVAADKFKIGENIAARDTVARVGVFQNTETAGR